MAVAMKRLDVMARRLGARQALQSVQMKMPDARLVLLNLAARQKPHRVNSLLAARQRPTAKKPLHAARQRLRKKKVAAVANNAMAVK